MKSPKFLVGLVIGGLLGIIFWYWQKSTSAEDGALAVLDRLAASEARVRELEAQLRMASPAPDSSPGESESVSPSAEKSPAQADDLQEIEGIGPTYAGRLQEAGIGTFADLAAQTPAQIVEISGVRSVETAVAWIDAAQARLKN